MSTADRRATLAGFLRTRRARLDPATVGVPTGPRRRTPGLRREEVAALAHISTTYYVYLEQARDVSPSPGVVDALATALALDPVERRYLDLLTSGGPRALPPLTAEGKALVAELVDAVGPPGLPAYAVDGDGAIVGANPAVEQWYGSLRRAPTILDWYFSADARAHLADWPAEARDQAARVRFHAAAVRLGPTGRAAIDRVLAADPDFAVWWAEHDVSDQDPLTRRFRHAEGTSDLRLLPVRTPVAPVSIVLHLPARTPAAASAAPDLGR